MNEGVVSKNDFDVERQRLYLNVIKGIAIFLMLWGHVIQCCTQENFDFFENTAFKIIYSFHMPLFMVVSGYLFFFSFQKREMKNLIIHRSKPLLWTIVVCSAFNYAITIGLIGIYSDHTLSDFFNGNLLSGYNNLWFLWSVLAASIGVAIICKKIKRLWLQLLLLIAWGIVVYAFPNGAKNLYVYPFFIIGFYYAQYGCKANKTVREVVKILSVIVFIVLLFFYEKKHYIYITPLFNREYSVFENVGIHLYRFLIGLVGSISVLSVVQWIFCFFVKSPDRKIPILSCISKLGEKSLQIYALSVSFLSFYLPLFYAKLIELVLKSNILAHNIYLYNFVYTPLIALFFAVGLYWLVRLFEKIKFSKILFGK